MERKTQDRPCLDPVELLLRRIAWKTLRGSLLTGTAVAAGCATNNDLVRDHPEDEVAAHTHPRVPDAGTLAALDAGAQLPGRGQPDGGVPREAYDPCAQEQGFPVRASELKLREPHDYVAVRQASGLWMPADDAGVETVETWAALPFEVISETGTPCATATDTACTTKIEGHAQPTVPSFCPQACVEWSVVTTRGDEVERWAEPNELRAVLGPIDSYDEALMVAASRGYDITCRPEEQQPWSGPPEAHLRWVRAVAEGYELSATQYAETCPITYRRHRLLITTSGEVQPLDSVLFPPLSACIGRVPSGLRARVRVQAGSAYGEHLAHCAHLEAASVYAFVRLADELHALGAPAALVGGAFAAADDEVRHARVMAALARRHGAVPTRPEITPRFARTLEEIALENAVEGCVRETYGALVGAHQAEHAEDPALRRTMRTIAEDEARHAAVSHRVHAWLMERLDPAAQARIRAAQRCAIDALHEECARDAMPALRTLAGLPSPPMARAMLSELRRELWDAPANSAA